MLLAIGVFNFVAVIFAVMAAMMVIWTVAKARTFKRSDWAAIAYQFVLLAMAALLGLSFVSRAEHRLQQSLERAHKPWLRVGTPEHAAMENRSPASLTKPTKQPTFIPSPPEEFRHQVTTPAKQWWEEPVKLPKD